MPIPIVSIWEYDEISWFCSRIANFRYFSSVGDSWGTARHRANKVIKFSEGTLLICVMKHLVGRYCISITLDKLVNFLSYQSDDKIRFVNSVPARLAMTMGVADSERGYLISIFQPLVCQNITRSHGSIPEPLLANFGNSGLPLAELLCQFECYGLGNGIIWKSMLVLCKNILSMVLLPVYMGQYSG